ncbi:DUF3015 family protein [Nitrospira sp. Kam-Ns4a]
MAWRECRSARWLPLVALFLLGPACTTKGTTKATTDPTTDILSSTSGRTWFSEEGLVREEYKVTAFATINFDHLRQEMARGDGEYLTALGTLLGVPAERRGEFFLLTRERYVTLFRTDRTTPEEMLASLRRELARHPELTPERPRPGPSTPSS